MSNSNDLPLFHLIGSAVKARLYNPSYKTCKCNAFTLVEVCSDKWSLQIVHAVTTQAVIKSATLLLLLGSTAENKGITLTYKEPGKHFVCSVCYKTSDQVETCVIHANKYDIVNVCKQKCISVSHSVNHEMLMNALFFR